MFSYGLRVFMRTVVFCVEWLLRTCGRRHPLSIKCIHLVQTHARRSFMLNQVSSVPWASRFEFVDAVNGHALQSVDSGVIHDTDGHTMAYKVTRTKPPSRPMLHTELGTTLSHLRAILAVDTTYGLILEDDVWLAMSHLWNNTDIMHVIRTAPSDWGLIQLGGSTPFTGEFVEWTSRDYGAYAYLVRKECIDAFRPFIQDGNGLHVDQHKSQEDFLYADFFIYGLVKHSTKYSVYAYHILSTYNNTTNMDSTIHTTHTIEHQRRTQQRLKDLLVCNLALPRLDCSVVYPVHTTPEPVSLCIPCHYRHLDRLRILLLSVYLQEVAPSEIVIALSSVPTTLHHASLQALVPYVPLKVIQTPDTRYAGENRNICIHHASHDIVSFIDADDMMHPSRLRIVGAIMSQRPQLATLYHSYANDAQFRPFQVLNGDVIYDLNTTMDGSTPYIDVPTDTGGRNGYGMFCNGFRIHNGHVTMRNSKVGGVRYVDKRRGQDAIFNRTILHTLGRHQDTMCFINQSLSYYLSQYSSSSWDMT